MKRNTEQFAIVRAKLQMMKEALIRESKAEIEQLLKEENKYSGISDDADLAQLAFREGMQAAKMTRNRARIKAVEEALMKIDEGTYGICEECEEHIPVKRLNAMPFALRCVECQERHEELSPVEENPAYSLAASR